WSFARLPQSIDPPVMLGADAAADAVHVPKAGLDDGHLHRFGVPVGKTVVRFFVMKSGGKLVPAFDACAVCGAYGYIETKGRLVCLACAADINPASLTAGGGCNPIPLAYREEPTELVISMADLKLQAAAFERSSPAAPAPPTPE